MVPQLGCGIDSDLLLLASLILPASMQSDLRGPNPSPSRHPGGKGFEAHSFAVLKFFG